MRIDKRLNLVIPVYRDDGSRLFVHSTPVSSDLFDTYWEPVGKAFSSIYSGGFGIIGGPRIAAKMLQKVATEMGRWDGPKGVRMGLVAEAHRLTNVLVPREKGGWETVPFDDARKTMLDKEDVSEIEGAIAFFTVVSLIHRRTEQAEVLAGAGGLWGAQTTSLDCTAFTNSLTTSTETESSGETQTPS
ncbi:MAG TPA: hypothetical protein VI653_27320 [Steroidobacteraceae bacterium]